MAVVVEGKALVAILLARTEVKDTVSHILPLRRIVSGTPGEIRR